MALSVSSHVCQDRRARGAEEVGKVRRPVVCNNQPFEAAGGTDMEVLDLRERRGGTGVVEHVSEDLLDRTRGGVSRVEGNM